MKVSALLNAELADTYGNLLSRVAAPTLNPQQVFPVLDSNLFPSRPGQSTTARTTDEDYLLVESVKRLPGIKMQPMFISFYFRTWNALGAIIGLTFVYYFIKIWYKFVWELMTFVFDMLFTELEQTVILPCLCSETCA